AVVLAAETMRCSREFRLPLRARSFREHAGMGGVADTVRAAAVADDVVVEHGNDVPALRLCIIGEHLAAVEALLLTRERGVDDRPREFLLREHPRRLKHSGRA